jgi:hypothetical protein
MPNENPNPLFAYAEARIAAWQAVLASLKAAMSLDPGGQMEGLDLSSISMLQNGESQQPIDLPDGAFFGKSIPACVKLYLSTARKKKTTKEIAAALREGGVETTAGNFESPVTTALNRLRAAGEVLRFKDGWGLSEWYPANLRSNTPATAGKTKARKKGKKTKTKGAPSLSSLEVKAESSKVSEITASPAAKTEPRILTFLAHREASAKDVASSLGMKIQTAHLVLGKLVHQKKLEKLPSGNFRVLGAAS